MNLIIDFSRWEEVMLPLVLLWFIFPLVFFSSSSVFLERATYSRATDFTFTRMLQLYLIGQEDM
jgi:hypothetical protein